MTFDLPEPFIQWQVHAYVHVPLLPCREALTREQLHRTSPAPLSDPSEGGVASSGIPGTGEMKNRPLGSANRIGCCPAYPITLRAGQLDHFADTARCSDRSPAAVLLWVSLLKTPIAKSHGVRPRRRRAGCQRFCRRTKCCPSQCSSFPWRSFKTWSCGTTRSTVPACTRAPRKSGLLTVSAS
jgi:hypothetical protein